MPTKKPTQNLRAAIAALDKESNWKIEKQGTALLLSVSGFSDLTMLPISKALALLVKICRKRNLIQRGASRSPIPQSHIGISETVSGKHLLKRNGFSLRSRKSRKNDSSLLAAVRNPATRTEPPEMSC